jgi:pimeloyl-ACP methyl ester carboxylesterase
MTGPALVLVPGMLCDERLFAPQARALEHESAVIVADLSRDDSISAMAERLLDVAPPEFALAGLSLGGIVAMEVIRRAPDRVTKLCLMATNHRAAGPAFIETRRDQSKRVRAGFLRDIVIHEMKGHYLSARNRTNRALLDLVVEMAMVAGPDVFIRQAEALIARCDQSDTLAKWRKPTLILCGEEDELCPPATHVAMQALMPQAHLTSLAETGHLLTLESADATSEALKAWLHPGGWRHSRGVSRSIASNRLDRA